MLSAYHQIILEANSPEQAIELTAKHMGRELNLEEQNAVFRDWDSLGELEGVMEDDDDVERQAYRFRNLVRPNPADHRRAFFTKLDPTIRELFNARWS